MSVTVRLLMAPPTELNRMAAASMAPELRARLHANLMRCYELAAPELAATIVPWLHMLAPDGSNPPWSEWPHTDTSKLVGPECLVGPVCPAGCTTEPEERCRPGDTCQQCNPKETP